MAIRNYLNDKRCTMFCTKGSHGQVATSLAFSFHQSLLLKNQSNLFCVSKIWEAHKVKK